MAISSGIVYYLSRIVGTSEPALRLILTILAGYPLGIIHRKYIYNKQPILQHLYFTITGFLLGYWNYGSDFYHCIYATLFTYCVFFILNGTALCVGITFVFNLGYLLLGYYYTSTENYDICWTMPQCILTLRLIGTAFDLYDGKQPVERLSADSKKLALIKNPNILEIFGHCFFPCSFLVGPQFSMKRYLEFVNGQFNNKQEPPDSVAPALTKLTYGLIYLFIFQMLGLFVSDNYLLSDEFGYLNLFKKMLLLGMWGRYTLYKYISCWLLTEGACILFGVAYNGEVNGEPQWNGAENVKLKIFENTTEFNHYIKSFNVNTNNWIAIYIYKRLKFLGNRHLSQLFSLIFLAVWHGLHSGYYICFFFEFIVIYFERDIKSIIQSSESLTKLFSSSKVQLPLQILLRFYTFVFMGWCLIPFVLLQYSKYFKAFANVNYIGVLLFILWPIVYAPILRFILKKCSKKRVEKM